MAHNPQFHKLLKDIEKIYEKKTADYATIKDPHSNLRECEKMGIPSWKGVLVRMGDKWNRICNLTKNGKVKNEPIEDSLLDLAIYSLICYLLYQENKK